ncbi:Gfo/Idh/MocA family oxidoreductase [Photobacterium angustum]|uniref:Oxidoreductase, Gfo/Idh/MocA family protein n=1 Tax=Photobacterium angustum (strain S14 / CCUG 15956) TaxID=314292 RepID=Q1ZVK8_PHOAS|nr:Gfo/Idh/MocA family oxidoreductase [Photobacterium angustum]EAS66052.1 oxidoreductase, Gfo/Idh/MocA family protein [Photobacterium angustum S14]
MRIGIVGLGDIAQKAYLPIMTQLKNVELIFCTRNPTVLNALADQYGVTCCLGDYRQLNKKNIDAVMIHAATHIHYDIAHWCIKQGIPTFVDKPLVDNAEQVERLYELAEQHNTPLYVGFNRRHIPLFNKHLPELASGNIGELHSLRWEKNRHNLVGDIRPFIFDDFIHALDSVNLNAKSTLDDVYVTHQMFGDHLSRVDVQWQSGQCLLHASMNRLNGITNECVSATYHNQSYQFTSFMRGQRWLNNEERILTSEDWMPMLATKGFDAMISDWLSVVESGTMPLHTVERNISTHQLADAVALQLETLFIR